MAGSFTVVTLPSLAQYPNIIGCRQIASVGIDPDEAQLAQVIMSDNQLLNRVAKKIFGVKYAERSEYRNSFNLFLAAAKTGVEHPNATLSLGKLAHSDARSVALQDIGNIFRNNFLLRVALNSVAIIVIGILLNGAVIYFGQLIPQTTGFPSERLSSFGYVLIGIGVAMWLGSALYLQSITWDKLDYLDPNGFSPMVRMFILISLAFVLIILLDLEAIIIGVGPVVLNKYRSSPGISILLGVLCALSQVQVIGIIQTALGRTSSNQQSQT